MAVIKLSKSKKAVLFTTDEGDVYMTSVAFLINLLEGRAVLLNPLRFAERISPDRFRPSTRLDRNTQEKYLPTTEDAFSPKSLKAKQEKKAYQDKNVW